MNLNQNSVLLQKSTKRVSICKVSLKLVRKARPQISNNENNVEYLMDQTMNVMGGA